MHDVPPRPTQHRSRRQPVARRSRRLPLVTSTWRVQLGLEMRSIADACNVRRCRRSRAMRTEIVGLSGSLNTLRLNARSAATHRPVPGSVARQLVVPARRRYAAQAVLCSRKAELRPDAVVTRRSSLTSQSPYALPPLIANDGPSAAIDGAVPEARSWSLVVCRAAARGNPSIPERIRRRASAAARSCGRTMSPPPARLLMKPTLPSETPTGDETGVDPAMRSAGRTARVVLRERRRRSRG